MTVESGVCRITSCEEDDDLTAMIIVNNTLNVVRDIVTLSCAGVSEHAQLLEMRN